MAKKETSRAPKKSSKHTEQANKKMKNLIPYNPVEKLLDQTFFAKTIVACLENNDPEGVINVINSYLEIANKAQIAKDVHMARSTLYHSLKQKNPTLKTLAKILHASAQSRK